MTVVAIDTFSDATKTKCNQLRNRSKSPEAALEFQQLHYSLHIVVTQYSRSRRLNGSFWSVVGTIVVKIAARYKTYNMIT